MHLIMVLYIAKYMSTINPLDYSLYIIVIYMYKVHN